MVEYWEIGEGDGELRMSDLRGRAYETLPIRISGHHRKYEEIRGRAKSIRAGLAGEERLLLYLKKMDLPYPILHDVSLKIGPGHFAQFDVIVLAPSAAVIYEAKNIAGRLRFETVPARLDKVDELGRITDKYDCPLLQLQDEIASLRTWFYHHDIPYAVTGAVVMAGSAIIEKAPLEGKLLSLRQLRMDLSHMNPHGRSLDELQRLACYIRDRDEPYLPFPLIEGVGIHPADGYWGPICEFCNWRLRRQSKRMWLCQSCKQACQDPYTRTLEDWFLLRSRTLNNRQVRELFDISSPSASRLLSEYSLNKGGSNRSTYYTWDYQAPLARQPST